MSGTKPLSWEVTDHVENVWSLHEMSQASLQIHIKQTYILEDHMVISLLVCQQIVYLRTNPGVCLINIFVFTCFYSYIYIYICFYMFLPWKYQFGGYMYISHFQTHMTSTYLSSVGRIGTHDIRPSQASRSAHEQRWRGNIVLLTCFDCHISG